LKVKFKLKIENYKDLNLCILCFLLIIPLLTRSFHFRIFLWMFPFLMLYFLDIKQIEESRIKPFSRSYISPALIYLSLNLILIFVVITLHPILLDFNLLNNINPNLIVNQVIIINSKGQITKLGFFFFLFIYITIWVVLIIINRQYYLLIPSLWLIFCPLYMIFLYIFAYSEFYNFLKAIFFSFYIYLLIFSFYWMRKKNLSEIKII